MTCRAPSIFAANGARIRWETALFLLLAALLSWRVALAAPPAVTGYHEKIRALAAGKTRRNAGPMTLLLDVTVNARQLKDIIRVEKLADGRLVLPAEAWSEARLRPSGEKLELADGGYGFDLDAVPGLTYKLDSGRLALFITAPAEAFEANAIDQGSGDGMPFNPAPPGFYFNYNLTGTRSADATLSYGAFLEGVAFNGMGSLVANGVLRGDDDRREIIRTDTYVQKDLPGSMETLALGDTIGSGGAWSRPVRFGGIRWTRNFALRPGFFSFPMPSISGSAALPSTVDVLVNNQRQQIQPVEPGPFSIVHVPVVTGAGEINLVVRDMLGVETLVTQNYYTSPRLLAPGLSDFSFEAGWLRENYGSRSSDYGALFAAATWRQGFNDAFTGEARLELQAGRQAAGFEVAGLLGHFAVAHAAASYSQEDGEKGGHYLVGLERRSLGGSGSVQWEYFDRDYTQFGSLPGEIRPRHRFTAGYGVALFQGVSAGAGYIDQSNWNGERFEMASANLGISLPWDLYLNVYASKQLDRDNGWSGGLNLMLPLGSQRTVSASSNRDIAGRIVNAVQASQSVPQGPGLGWRMRLSDDPVQLLQAGGTLNTNFGQFSADANKGEDGAAIRLGAHGSLGWLQGLPFATRDIGHGSFAVVKVGGIKDVRVYRSNQVAATTDGNGMALVPNLLPYQQNQITIAPDELPFDVEIKGVKEMATPYARSGVLVEFPVRRSRNALVELRQADGKPVPAGGQITVSPGGRKFIVAQRGLAYLTDLEPDNLITVQWKKGRCELAVVLAPDGPAEPRIGPLICGDSP